MTSKKALFVSIVAVTLSQAAQANIEVTFTESAPKDRFVISNTGVCALEDTVLTIDLSDSVGRLIFDTTSTGAGVEVFQPFEATKGAITVVSPEGVKDGDSQLSINIPTLASGQFVSFTIDVDDTLKQSALGNIRVAGSEIANGSVSIRSKTITPVQSLFSNKSMATLTIPSC